MFLKLEGRPTLIVGAGPIALEKIESLLPTGAALHIVAPEAIPQIQTLAAQGRLTWTQREYRSSDLDDACLVITATSTPAVNQAVYQDATRRGILCNSVDDPPFCDFYFGSLVRRGDLQIAISTNGDSPALSQRLRREIDARLPQDLGPWLAQLGELRREVLASHPPGEARKHLLHTLAQRSLCESYDCPSRRLAFATVNVTSRAGEHNHATSTVATSNGSTRTAQSQAGHPAPDAPVNPGKVYLVGAGPGDPDLLTVKAARLLAAADVVLHDDLVPAEIVSLARSLAWVLNVGKRCGAKSITQEEINRLMVDFARRGLTVVRLKSGDPLVFGRANEEIDALRSSALDFEVIPGITAAFAAAASLQCSLTDRRAASAVVFSTGHHSQSGNQEQRPAPAADATRVVYMPGRDLRSMADQWLREGLPPDLPCVIVSRVTLPDQQVRCTLLADLAEADPGPSPSLLLAGWALRAVKSSSSWEHSHAGAAVPSLSPAEQQTVQQDRQHRRADTKVKPIPLAQEPASRKHHPRNGSRNQQQ